MKFAASGAKSKLLSFRSALSYCRRYSSEASGQRRMSPLNIQMLSKHLHKQIFGGAEHVASPEAVRRSQTHLDAHGLWGKGGTLQPNVDISIPPLQGDSIDEHFRSIAAAQCEPYLSIARHVASWQLPAMPKKWRSVAGWTRYDGTDAVSVDYPEESGLIFDVEVLVTEGHLPVMAVAASDKHWYSWTSRRLESCEEYYGHEEKPTELRNLVPMGSLGHRLIVGHNVAYDRARIKEQYMIEDSLTRFMDTLSLHVCVAGQTSAQKGLWKHRDGASKVEAGGEDWMSISCPNGLADVHWLYVGAQKGRERLNKDMRNTFVKGKIQDVRKGFQALMKYCAQDVLHTHEVFQAVLPAFLKRCPHPVTLAGMLEMGTAYLPVASNWNQYLGDSEYMYEDMEREIKSKLMTLADDACVYMHNERYKDDLWLCNLDWEPKKFRGKAMTKAAMKKLIQDIEDHTKRQEEMFSSATADVDKEEEFKYMVAAKEPGSFKRRVHMPGYPGWYRDLCMRRSEDGWVPGCVHISAQTRVTPYLLRMTWKGHPLHYHKKMGWGYVIPKDPGDLVGREEYPGPGEECGSIGGSESSVVEDVMAMLRDMDLGEETLLDTKKFLHEMDLKVERAVSQGDSDGGDKQEETGDTSQEEWVPVRISSAFGTTDDVVMLRGKEHCFYKIPHKDGPGANCGNPLSKDYLHKMEDGTLSSAAGMDGQRILMLNSMVSFWRSARNRIMDQFVVATQGEGEEPQGVIIPQVIVAGTATRRAVEPTWLTASNAKENRLGSELKALVRAPPGYHLVGADVDSQELWIASVMGDMHSAGMHGSTAIGWMTLQGSKSDGTDVHSKTARAVGISRDHAKVLNYGRFYGAGRPFTELLMKQFNPSLSSEEVVARTNTLFMATKGTRGYQLTKEGASKAKSLNIPFDANGVISAADLMHLRQALGRSTSSLATKVWVGGSESDLFNKLETIAASNQPKTPVLGCCISKALERRYVGNEFVTSKVNWVVQSSAVDYLHLMLVCMRWLLDAYKINGRFCISIHDEVRYLVKSEDRYRAALALQITNLLTRSMFAYCLGMKDLPLSVAFFSAVDMDTVLRKEVAMDCRTPSNPLGLKEGHGIPSGEALNIYEILERTGGRLEPQIAH